MSLRPSERLLAVRRSADSFLDPGWGDLDMWPSRGWSGNYPMQRSIQDDMDRNRTWLTDLDRKFKMEIERNFELSRSGTRSYQPVQDALFEQSLPRLTAAPEPPRLGRPRLERHLSSDVDRYLPDMDSLALADTNRNRQLALPSAFQSDLTSFDSKLREMEARMNEVTRRYLTLAPFDPHKMALQLEHPIKTNPDGSRKLALQFDVRQFKPEEITVKTKDNFLSVGAHHEEKTDRWSSVQDYQRQYLLPEGVDAESLACSLSSEGVLSVEAPVAPPPQAKAITGDTPIQIQHQKD